MAIRLTWNQPFTNTDGTPFDAVQFLRYEIQLDALPVSTLPVAWDADGAYVFEADATLADGSHTGRIRVVNRSGAVSAWSNTATFVVAKVPEAPTSFSIA